MAIRWIQDGEPHAAEVYNRPLRDFVLETGANVVLKTTKVNVSNGLSGGGELSGDIDVVGVDATATRKGVTRFATLAEAIDGTVQNVAIAPNVLKQAIPQSGLGEGQSWQDVAASRALGVTYTNTTGRPIAIIVTLAVWHQWVSIVVNGVAVDYFTATTSGSITTSRHAIVPAGATYGISHAGPTKLKWVEMR